MNDDIKNIFLTKYTKAGNSKFYEFLVDYSINRVDNLSEVKGATPEVELMNYYDQFLDLYRKEENTTYLDIAKIFRRAGHKIYNIMIKREIITRNNKFLNLVE